MGKGKKVYAVKVGRKPGLYFTWKDCNEQITGYAGAKYKAFMNEEEALHFMDKEISNSIKSKYYAVKIGKTPGIYTSWADCQKQIFKYPCAQYKSFFNEVDALDYMEELEFGDNNSSERYIEVYTDGSCLDNANGKYVGYACFFGELDGRNFIGYQLRGSNNVGEMKAVISALESVNYNGNVIIHTDSTYVLNGVNRYKKYTTLDLMEANFSNDLKNRDLWIELMTNLQKYKNGSLLIKKVKAHEGIFGNERVDEMAKEGAMLSKELEK